MPCIDRRQLSFVHKLLSNLCDRGCVFATWLNRRVCAQRYRRSRMYACRCSSAPLPRKARAKALRCTCEVSLCARPLPQTNPHFCLGRLRGNEKCLVVCLWPASPGCYRVHFQSARRAWRVCACLSRKQQGALTLDDRLTRSTGPQPGYWPGGGSFIRIFSFCIVLLCFHLSRSGKYAWAK